ncbi:hypothetical protein WMY93_026425 [Mugilogobius chulae]|uniref:Extracellular matrix protein 1 n=1 Tax=Mugilogobius chulae TaxID=88201 RepID=A0AAW0N0W1_9GOBI
MAQKRCPASVCLKLHNNRTQAAQFGPIRGRLAPPRHAPSAWPGSSVQNLRAQQQRDHNRHDTDMSAPTRACVCAFAALALVCLGSASSDVLEQEPIEQREVTFDIRQVMKGRPRPVIPAERYPVQFPLARPSPENIGSICLHGDRRPRYPPSYFPRSGFGVHKREADAVNTLEAWFTTCCGQNQTEEALLCCATQAWEKSISHFCEVGFRIKAPHFHCCKRNSSERLPCFDSAAKNKDYSPSEESPVQPEPPKAKFNFDPSSCSGTVTPQSISDGKRRKKEKKLSASLKVDIDFPLAMPTDSNHRAICANLKVRPRYNVKCLDGLGRDLVVEQAKTHNNIERRFTRCCSKRQEILPCLDSAWKQEMKRFCSSSKRKNIDFPCCDGGVQFDCFENVSTNRDYNQTLADSLSLDNICDTHKMLSFKYLPRIPLKSTADKCCHSRLKTKVLVLLNR